MVHIPGLGRRGKSWYYRRRVPQDIARYKGEQVWISLHTRDYDEARRRVPDAMNQAEATFNRRRAGEPASCDTVPPEANRAGQCAAANEASKKALPELPVSDARRLYADFTLKGERQNRIEYRQRWDRLPNWKPRPTNRELADHFRGQAKKALLSYKDDIAAQDFRQQEWFLDLLDGDGIGRVKDRRQAVLVMARARIDVLTNIENLLAEDPELLPTSDPPRAREPDIRKDNPLLSQAASDWIAGKQNWAPGSEDRCRTAFDAFIEIAGDKSISEYTKNDMREFKELLLASTSNRSKRQATRGLSIRDAAKVARHLGLPRLSPNTINTSYLGVLFRFFSYAVDHYNGMPPNPFEGCFLHVGTDPHEDRDPFTVDDLKTLFAGPNFVDPALRNSAKFWIPLLGLHTGARLNELCKLKCQRRSDFASAGRSNSASVLNA